MVGTTKPVGGASGASGAGSHESDSGVQYHVMRRFQAAGPHGGDGEQYRATGRYQTAESHESESGVQYRVTGWFQAARSTLSEQAGGLRRR